MPYLDTAALVKLVRREAESEALADWLDERVGPAWVASMLVEVELPRAIMRVEPTLLPAVPAVLARLDRYEIDEVVRAAAAAMPGPLLRTFDAIHLATASSVFGAGLEAFVSYDQRLLDAAERLRLPIASPGRPS